MSDAPRVSVMVLSYNRPALLEVALTALRAQTWPSLDVTVVDNASPRAAEVEAVVRRHPDVTFVQTGRNLGFTGGMNVALARARGPWVLLTEDDIALEPDCVAALMADAQAHPDTACSGALMLNRDAGTIRCAGCMAQLGAVYRPVVLGEGEEDRGQFTARRVVDFIPGAVVFGRTERLRRLGGFREDFFMYCEDLELCLRAARAGWSVAMVPAARVTHAEPQPGPWSALLEYHKLKNLAATYLLHAEGRVLPGFALRYGVLGLLRALAEPRRLVPHLRAWIWVALHVPVLLRDRRGLRRDSRPPRETRT